MRILTLTKLPCLFAEQLILNSSWDLPYRDYLDSFGLALHLILLTLYLVQEMSHSMNPFLWSLYFQHCIDTIPVNHCFFNKEFYYSTVTVAAYTCQVKRLHCMVKKKKKKKNPSYSLERERLFQKSEPFKFKSYWPGVILAWRQCVG